MTEIRLTMEDPTASIRALRYVVEEYLAKQHAEGMVGPGSMAPLLDQIADSIEEQVKPAIEEPLAFGSIVKATTNLAPSIGSPGLFWVKIQGAWTDDGCGVSRQWGDLDVIEVLRVGVGDEAAYNNGVSDTVSALVARLLEKRHGTNLMQKRDAFTEAIKIAEALS